MLQVFVYGTLKPGYANYQAYCGDRTVASCPALVKGKLFDLPVGYPALSLGEEWVKGYVLSFDNPDVLVDLDELEDYGCDRPMDNNLYQREWVEIFDPQKHPQGSAWVYRMALDKIQKLGGLYIPKGEW